MMNRLAEPPERTRSPGRDLADPPQDANLPQDPAVEHVPAVFLCVVAVWALVLLVVALRLIAGDV